MRRYSSRASTKSKFQPYRPQHGVPISSVARQIATSDFAHFTHILAADESNLRDLNRKKPRNATADVRLWGSYLDGKAIPDPYYGGIVRLLCLMMILSDILRC